MCQIRLAWYQIFIAPSLGESGKTFWSYTIADKYGDWGFGNRLKSF